MKAHILEETRMRELGFTDFAKEHWYYVARVYKGVGWESVVTFNLNIPKDDPDKFKIDVLDDSFCQPYDYQYLLAKYPDPPEAASIVRDNVNAILQKLTDVGIISDWKPGDYV